MQDEAMQMFESLKVQFHEYADSSFGQINYELLETVLLTRLELPEDPFVHQSLRAVLESDGSLDEFLDLVGEHRERLLA